MDMGERSRVMTAACAGAAIGGVWAWLYFTEQGGRVRDHIEPTVDRFVAALDQLLAAGDKTRDAIDEGRRLLIDVTAGQQSA